jgi:hypothetical protein
MPSEVQDIFGHTSHETANRIYAHSGVSFLRPLQREPERAGVRHGREMSRGID